ncbi:hypothetical protein OVA14_07240 [Agrococcus sp. SL85]|uniref:hypothetical protein n=1 Tax=Agrococcus sp. SL85 TaxID=2995141 RepID=UPI00226D3408|nr:hypothetical protein [Agrococcus sp. SL85]WAC65187.1 hypothetical protein OVA14_07240 [Agrococcus sp. SL85]
MSLVPGVSPLAASLAPRITFGSFEFVTAWHERPPAAAVVVANAMTGWDDAPQDDSETFEHPSGDGLESGLDRYGARTITVAGFIDADNVAALQAAKRRLKRERRGVLVVDDRASLLALEADVRRLTLTWQRVTETHERFTLVLLADDPLRYTNATQRLIVGANTLANDGDERAWPLLTFTGPTGAVTITHPGGAWTLTATAAGSTRVVDLRNGDIWQDGVRIFGADSGPAPSIAAETTATWQVANLGSGRLGARRIGAYS